MRLRRADINRVLSVILFSSVFFLVPSCGGRYKARKVNMPGEKIEIADALFGMGKYGDSAAEYKDFLATFAGDEKSDYAQFRLAESYRMDGDYPMAAVEYRILINDYNYSEYIDDAFFLEGLCAFKQAPRAERDQTKSYEALGRISRFLQIFADSPRRREAEDVLLEIQDLLGNKAFRGAKLYYSKKRYDAALIYFDKIINSFPDTVWRGKSHYYKGIILERRGENEKAVFEFGEALSSRYDFDEKDDAGVRLRSLSGGGSVER